VEDSSSSWRISQNFAKGRWLLKARRRRLKSAWNSLKRSMTTAKSPPGDTELSD